MNEPKRRTYDHATWLFYSDFEGCLPVSGPEAEYYWIQGMSGHIFRTGHFENDRLNLLLPLIKYQVDNDMLTEWMREELQLYFEDYAAGRLREQLIPEEAEAVIADLLACYRKVFGPVDPKRYAGEPPKPRRRLADIKRPPDLPIRYNTILHDMQELFHDIEENETLHDGKQTENYWLWDISENGRADAERLNVLLPLMRWQAEHRSYTPLVLHDLRSYYRDYLNGSLRPTLAYYEADEVLKELCWCYETVYGTKELVDEPIPPGIPGQDYEYFPPPPDYS